MKFYFRSYIFVVRFLMVQFSSEPVLKSHPLSWTWTEPTAELWFGSAVQMVWFGSRTEPRHHYLVLLTILTHLITTIVLIMIVVITILRAPDVLVQTLRTPQTILTMDALATTVITTLKTPTQTMTLQPKPYVKKSWVYSEESLQKVRSRPVTPTPSMVPTLISSLPS